MLLRVACVFVGNFPEPFVDINYLVLMATYGVHAVIISLHRQSN